MHDKDTQDAITEINSKLELQEQAITRLGESVLQLETILQSIADHIIPDEETND